MSVLDVVRAGLAATAIVAFVTPAAAVDSKSLVTVSIVAPSVVYADEKKCPEGEEWNEEMKKCEKKKS